MMKNISTNTFVTAYSMLRNHGVAVRRIDNLAAAYATMDKSFKNYVSSVEEPIVNEEEN